MTDARPLFLFDGDCAFCTSSAQWVEKRLRPRETTPVTVQPYQYADLAALGTDAGRAQREVLWVNEAGEIFGGAQAFARWLQRSSGLWRVAGTVIRWRPVRPLAAVVYRWVARNRSHLPGGTPACALRPPKDPEDKAEDRTEDQPTGRPVS